MAPGCVFPVTQGDVTARCAHVDSALGSVRVAALRLNMASSQLHDSPTKPSFDDASNNVILTIRQLCVELRWIIDTITCHWVGHYDAFWPPRLAD